MRRTCHRPFRGPRHPGLCIPGVPADHRRLRRGPLSRHPGVRLLTLQRAAGEVGLTLDLSEFERLRRAFQRYEKMKPSDWARKSEKDGGL